MAGSVLFLQKRIVKSKRVSKRGCLPYVFCQQTHLKYANFPADPSQFPPRGPMVFFLLTRPVNRSTGVSSILMPLARDVRTGPMVAATAH